ncbi:MAG: metallophosphoesterase [Candidatus Sericytochromatia bacterium]|nr:metallophosphoesterase [Candidatus Sericytochromatia bacterium]
MPEHFDLPAQDTDRVFRIGLLTDIHFGNDSLRARQELAFCRMDSLGLRLLCLMGDIVDNALSDNYETARRLVNKLNTPMLALTGNHEVFPLSLPVEACLANFRTGMGRPRHYAWRYFDPYLFVFLGIDQREPHLPKTRRDTGTSEQQLQWLRATLQAHAQTPTVIVSHAPLENTVEDSDHFPLAASSQLYDILGEAPQVFLWLSGHTHLPDVHCGESLKTAVALGSGCTFVHVPPVADYYVHVIKGDRQFFRGGEDLQTRLLTCHPDRIEVQTYDILANALQPMVTVRPTIRRASAA